MWFWMKVPHRWDGSGVRTLTMYFATVESATLWPSSASSEAILGAPQVTFSVDIRRISWMTSMLIGGRPGFERDFILQ